MASREPAFAGPKWNRDFYRALGQAIKVARTEQGLERKELARVSGISYPYVSEIEKGKKRASTEVLLPIAQALGLKQSELLERAEHLLERARADSTQMGLHELASRAEQLGADDFNRVLDLARRLSR